MRIKKTKGAGRSWWALRGTRVVLTGVLALSCSSEPPAGDCAESTLDLAQGRITSCQAAVDELRGVRDVDGALNIRGDVVDHSGLHCLREVDWIVIVDAPNLTEVPDFSWQRKADRVDISNSPRLARIGEMGDAENPLDLDGIGLVNLRALAEVGTFHVLSGGSVSVESTGVSDLGFLSELVGTLNPAVADNADLERLDDFVSLENVYASFIVAGNPSLVACQDWEL